jgi:SAM-dependent methyltransferase
MAQNIYDDPAFFAAYSQFRRSREGLDGAAEWPALRTLLPPMHGLDVVDLGCGFGWFCRWARAAGARAVLGLDLSANMLARARAETADPAVRYAEADLDALELPEAAFDLAHSSLTFHYLEDFGRLARRVRRALKPGGRLVFSIEHPIYMAPSRPEWVELPDGRQVWPLDGYQREGPRTTDWLVPGVVKHHRTLATTLNELIDSGFAIRRVEEWKPSAEQLATLPDAARELDRPMFLLLAADAAELG